jgi:tetratricopeptide (TPR) repeat protein
MEKRQDASTGLPQDRSLITDGSFDKAIEENQHVLFPVDKHMSGDEVLFSKGLTYAHHDNQEKDFNKSRDSFAKLVRQFPDSSLVDQANIWISMIDVINTLEQKSIEDEKVIAKLNKQISDLNHVLASRKLPARGDFMKAIEENRKALLMKGKSPLGDEALFNLGLLYAHHDNPEKDFNKSAGFFRTLVEEYPQSPLVEQAHIWVGILTIIEKSKQVDIEIEKRKKELAQ